MTETAMAASRLIALSNGLAATGAVFWLGGCGAGMAGIGVGFFVGVPGFVLLVTAGVVGQVGRAKQKRVQGGL
jgi:hypothetical protein